MSQPLYLTYFAEEAGRRWGLSIHLDAGAHVGADSVWLRDLHAAANRWRQGHPDVFLRSDLAVEATPGLPRGSLPSYLYASGLVNGDRLRRHLSMLQERGRIHRYAIRPGGLAEGLDLVGREMVGDSLLGVLQAETSCHLRAPRRYGKSSVLRRLARMLGEREQPCLLVDVSDSRTIPDFLLSLARAAIDAPLCATEIAAIPELSRWPGGEVGILEKSRASQELQGRIQESPWSFAGRLFGALGRLRAVLILDEFSVFLRIAVNRDASAASQLLDLLARSRRDAAPTVQLFAGSAGLTSYIRFHALGSAFEGVESIDLPPLARPAAAVLAEELLYGEGMAPTPEVVDRMLLMLGDPIPYFLHVLADAMKEASDPVTPGGVEEAYTRRVLGDRGNNVFRTYRVSDQPYPEGLRRAAAALLRETTRSGQGATEEALRDLFSEHAPGEPPDRFADLLACLQEDYDLALMDGRWRMRGKVLRDRWLLAEPWLTGAEGM